jgi:hypothetical protein
VPHLIAAMLIAASALDLARCSLVAMTTRHHASAAWLIVAGIGAAAVSMTAARGCRAGRRWAGWAALLIGVASAPQASASGFCTPYAVPDVATAALGILLTVTVLATAGLPRAAAEQTRKPLRYVSDGRRRPIGQILVVGARPARKALRCLKRQLPDVTCRQLVPDQAGGVGRCESPTTGRPTPPTSTSPTSRSRSVTPATRGQPPPSLDASIALNWRANRLVGIQGPDASSILPADLLDQAEIIG